MKVAIFTETFLPLTDGIVTRLCATIDVLLEEGAQVLVIAPDKGVTSYKGAVVVGVKGYPLPVYPEKQFSLPTPRLRKILKEFQPDLIHAVNPVNIGAFGIYYAKRFRIPLISSYHTNVPAYLKYYGLKWLEPVAWFYLRWLHNLSQLNLCTSATTLQELRSQGIHRVHLWERGVDRSKFGRHFANPSTRQLLSGGQVDKTVFLYVGRLGHEKGLHQLRPILDRNPNLIFAFVGDGPARADLEKLFANTGCVFTGYLHGEALAQAYASADAFVFPSTTETLGLVLMEAMASGLPIVAAKSGPTMEMLQDGLSALLFDPGDPDSLSRQLLRLSLDPALQQQLGEAALAAASDLDWRKPTLQLLNYYQKAQRIQLRYRGERSRRKASRLFAR